MRGRRAARSVDFRLAGRTVSAGRVDRVGQPVPFGACAAENPEGFLKDFRYLLEMGPNRLPAGVLLQDHCLS